MATIFYSQDSVFLVCNGADTCSQTKGLPALHYLDPGEHSLLQELDVGVCIESKSLCQDKWKHNVSISSDLTTGICSARYS